MLATSNRIKQPRMKHGTNTDFTVDARVLCFIRLPKRSLRFDDAVAFGEATGQTHSRLQGAFHVADEGGAAVFAGEVQASQALFESGTDRRHLSRRRERITAARQRVIVPVDEIRLYKMPRNAR